MSNPKTLKATPSAISSLESPAGHTRLNWQEFREMHQSGPDHVPVSRFRALDSEKDMPIDAISGPLFNTSSPSAGLQSCLANRLRAKMAGSGSPLYALTWSEWDMPAGVAICRLRAWARRTYGNDYSGWPTTSAGDHFPQSPLPEHLNAYMGNPSPRMKKAGWATPLAQRNKRSAEFLKGREPSPEEVGIEVWATPTSRDHKDGATTLENTPVNHLLGREVLLTGWRTPRSVEAGHSTGNPNRATDGLSRLEDQVHGAPLNTSNVPMEKRGQLNPAFSRWLMGFLEVFEKSAPFSEDWRQWQVLMAPLSQEQRSIGLGLSEPTETR